MRGLGEQLDENEERGRDCDYPTLGYEERRREIEESMERRDGGKGERRGRSERYHKQEAIERVFDWNT